MKKEKRQFGNAEDEGCVVLVGRCFGGVDEVVGDDSAAEIGGFVPRRDELLQLLAFWERVALRLRWTWFTTGDVDSSDELIEAFAQRRIARIWDLIGEPDATRIIDGVYGEFAAAIKPYMWRRFLSHDEAVVSAVSEKKGRAVQEASQCPTTTL